MTQIKADTFLGALSVYKDNKALITAKENIQKHYIRNPTVNLAVKVVEVKTRELKNHSKIRIPASFFQQLDRSVVESQRQYLKKILVEDTLNPQCFQSELPLKSKVVSQFGSPRRLPTGQEYFHTGLDLRATTGTSILAMAPGKIRVASEFVVAGRAVFIEHGYSIFSKYYHLDEIHVEEGDDVLKGDLIGKSGATGRVEAPHLHWEVSWKGISIDPIEFLNLWKTICV